MKKEKKNKERNRKKRILFSFYFLEQTLVSPHTQIKLTNKHFFLETNKKIKKEMKILCSIISLFLEFNKE